MVFYESEHDIQPLRVTLKTLVLKRTKNRVCNFMQHLCFLILESVIRQNICIYKKLSFFFSFWKVFLEFDRYNFGYKWYYCLRPSWLDQKSFRDPSEYGFCLSCICMYKKRISNSALMLRNTGQRKACILAYFMQHSSFWCNFHGR